MFQKKLIVVAVAGALGAGATGAAFSQTAPGSVEIYGRLYPEFTVMKSSGATATTATVANGQLSSLSAPATGLDFASRNSVDASNTRLGFRGTENLGGGLKTVWQIEQKIPIDTGGGNLASRDSFVGLERSGFGTVRLGFMTTVYKDNREPIRPIGGTESGNIQSASNVLASVPWAGKTTFHVRQANSIRYDSASFGGLTFAAQYAPDEIRKPSPGAANLNADLWSIGVKYQRGPWYATLSHEIHRDFFGASGSLPAAVANSTSGAGDIHSKDTATRAVAAYTWGPSRVSLTFSPLKYEESGTRAAGKFDSYKHNTWEIAWEQHWGGPWTTAVFYVSASAGTCGLTGGVACSTTGLAGNMLGLTGEYAFSKRTALFALYTKLNNGASSMYNNAANVAVGPGSDITQYALGLRHNF